MNNGFKFFPYSVPAALIALSCSWMVNGLQLKELSKELKRFVEELKVPIIN